MGFWPNFLPSICIFGPFDLLPNQITMQTRCWWFFVLWGTKILHTPIKFRILAQKRLKLVQNLHFWSFWAKYCHFLHILSNAWPKNNVNKVPRWVFRYVGNKTFDFSSKKKVFLPQNDQIWPKIGIFGQLGPGHAGLFGALLVGRLVVVEHGLYLARHLFTLSNIWTACN